jgi:hypothetical protein
MIGPEVNTCRCISNLMLFGEAGPLAELTKDSKSKLGSM